jgi:MoaA/NifB/PqqE/SkfB family radical SAM enzyme
MIVPRELTIEVNASCQLRCPTCPTTGNGYPPAVGSGRLTFDDFKHIVDGNPHVRRVYLENRGEMFLNPELVEILKYGYEKGIRMYADSGVNLNTVFPGALEAVVKYRLHTLLCSIDGASADTYAVYRKGGDFNRVIEHMREINAYKRKYHSRYPALTWQFVVFGHNEHELPRARAMASGLGMYFHPKLSWDSVFSPIRNVEFVKKQTGWHETTREEYEAKNGVGYMRSVCLALWRSPRVNWDGTILGCCWNSWGDFGGNAFRDGYVSAVNNEKMACAHEMLLGKMPTRDDIPCAQCSLFQSYRKNGKFITEREIKRLESPLYQFLRMIYRHMPAALPPSLMSAIESLRIAIKK